MVASVRYRKLVDGGVSQQTMAAIFKNCARTAFWDFEMMLFYPFALPGLRREMGVKFVSQKIPENENILRGAVVQYPDTRPADVDARE